MTRQQTFSVEFQYTTKPEFEDDDELHADFLGWYIKATLEGLDGEKMAEVTDIKVIEQED
jgi:hypothetical protein